MSVLFIQVEFTTHVIIVSSVVKVLVAKQQINEQWYYKLACIFTYTFSLYMCAVEDLTRLSSHERLHAFPELSRDQIDTLLKVPALICWMHYIKPAACYTSLIPRPVPSRSLNIHMGMIQHI